MFVLLNKCSVLTASNLFCVSTGQIATNEALKRDLESIIIGLQEYLESIKRQAKQASDECKELQKDKASLLQRLANVEEERNNLEIVAMDAENMRKVRLNAGCFSKFRNLRIDLEKKTREMNKLGTAKHSVLDKVIFL